MSNSHGHEHQDHVEQQILEWLRVQHDKSIANGVGCEFAHALISHFAEILVVMTPEVQQGVIDDVTERANTGRVENEVSNILGVLDPSTTTAH